MFLGDFCMLKYNIYTCHIFWTWLKLIGVNRTLKWLSLKRRWLSLQNCFLFYKNFDLTNRQKPEILKQPTKHYICSEYETFGLIFLIINYICHLMHQHWMYFYTLYSEVCLCFLKITESLRVFFMEYKLSLQSFLVLLSLLSFICSRRGFGLDDL